MLDAVAGDVGSPAGPVDVVGGDAVDALHAAAPEPDDIVLLQDPARAFTPVDVIGSVVNALRAGAPAVVPVQPVTDTIKAIDAHGSVHATVDRATLRAVQGPRGFRAATLSSSGNADPFDLTGVVVHPVAGDPLAMRVDTPFDLAVAEALLAEKVGP
jgi:2-C-methyl-D-erythritol 4-phosphate cytidylyltransferase